MITLESAAEHIGAKVIYDSGHGLEEGVITSVNKTYVFVRYGSHVHSTATYPADLTFLAGTP